MKRWQVSVLVAALFFCSCTAASASSCDVGCGDGVGPWACAAGCGGQGICGRDTLTGDWLGLRSGLQESGITFEGRAVQYGFGIDGGIDTEPPIGLGPLGFGDTFEYTGRSEYDFKFDLEKFGGLPHGSLLVRAEHWYGEYGNVSLRSGAFAPAVFPALLPTAPNNEGVPYITNFLVTQPLSENFVLSVGKKDVLGFADQDVFAGGDGTTQFVNQAFIANPAFLLALPYTGFTIAAASPQDWGMIAAFVYDPKDRTRDFFSFNDLFNDGIIVGGEVKVKTNFFEKPGQHHVGGIWKHVELTDLEFAEPPPSDYPYKPVPGFPTIGDAYTLYYGFDQYFQLYPGTRPSPLPNKPPRGWGMFGRASISDANPTPIRYFLSVGIGGNSPLRNHQDNWGIGWYYVGASDEFGPLPQTVFDPQDGTGVEIFYNFQINKWLNFTPDLQYIRPGNRAIANDAIVYGVRVGMKL